jgi:hypothetical protein
MHETPTYEYSEVRQRIVNAIELLRKEELAKKEEGDFKQAEQAKLKILQLKDDLRNLSQIFNVARNKENMIEVERKC